MGLSIMKLDKVPFGSVHKRFMRPVRSSVLNSLCALIRPLIAVLAFLRERGWLPCLGLQTML